MKALLAVLALISITALAAFHSLDSHFSEVTHTAAYVTAYSAAMECRSQFNEPGQSADKCGPIPTPKDFGLSGQPSAPRLK